MPKKPSKKSVDISVDIWKKALNLDVEKNETTQKMTRDQRRMTKYNSRKR